MPTSVADNILEISSLVSGYGAILAVREANLHVQKGQIVALIGANGAGKTTLINTVSGAVRARSGRIMFEGNAIIGEPPYRTARMGLIQVPEGRQILGPLSVEENLELGCQALGTRSKPSQADRERVYSLFPILKERRKQLAGSLSGGEQQMLAIGRALMGQPRLLLLDEPSLGLAPVIVDQVYKTLLELNEDGLTMLIVEQNAKRALQVSKYAFVMENGAIIHSGYSEILQNDPSIQESYLGQS